MFYVPYVLVAFFFLARGISFLGFFSYGLIRHNFFEFVSCFSGTVDDVGRFCATINVILG